MMHAAFLADVAAGAAALNARIPARAPGSLRVACLGLGRHVALHRRSSALHQICSHIRRLFF
jgi:hypothetical protein